MFSHLKTYSCAVIGAGGAALGVWLDNWYVVGLGALLGAFYDVAVDFVASFVKNTFNNLTE